MNLLRINDLSEAQITDIFALAEKLMLNESPPLLKGKTFVLFFPETSIRTRITFEKGIRDLGGEVLLFPPDTLDKRERLSDVIPYIANWSDGVIIRHPDFSKLREIAEFSPIPVINAMTSDHHPCEILSDMYTISRMNPRFRELVYTFVGRACNISRSWMDIARVLDLEFHQVCLPGYELSEGEGNRNYRFHTELEPVLRESDVVLTDSLPEALRTQEYLERYQITLERMKLSKRGAVLNPCPPFYRNEEVGEDAVSSDFFVGYGFKKNLLYVQQAVLLYCCSLGDICISPA